MELNPTNTTKQTLQTAMKNEQHLCLSDSDIDEGITYSSPARFHSTSDSDSTSETNKAINTNTASRTNSTTAHGNVNRDSSPARSSIPSDQISLPHESFTMEDNINKSSAAPTRSPPEKPQIPEVVVKRYSKEEPLALVKADLFVGDGTDSVGDGGRKIRPPLRKAKMEDEMVKKAALGFRIVGFLFGLVSFSVLAADRNQGWALDSFERYMEFRYCISVNVIGFVYSGAQAFDLAYQSATGKNIVQHHLRYIFDFALDQANVSLFAFLYGKFLFIRESCCLNCTTLLSPSHKAPSPTGARREVVTYLLISASSSAATRIDDWQSNWGKDKFPDMASASVAMSFLAFAALAFSSLISGYVLCNSRST
ncbi:hypothetical protein RND71_011254 [Anisodus tanguticus]|uniref:CASP-like protein n=1 Tax=Anisodus tanguticus TaxID=243964 RepID=A0AAE1VFW0_9SOLA|nr:hypothetical protein RND71_011254 [Anisodus tanguticus]